MSPLALLLPAALAAGPDAEKVLVSATLLRADDVELLDTLADCSADPARFGRAIALAADDPAVTALSRPTLLTLAHERAEMKVEQGESQRISFTVTPRMQDEELVLDLDLEMITPDERGGFRISRVTDEAEAVDGNLEVLRAGSMLVATTAWRVEGEEDVQVRMRSLHLDAAAAPRRARARRRALEAACSAD